MSTGTDKAVGEDTGTAGGKEGVFKRKRIVVVGAHLADPRVLARLALEGHSLCLTTFTGDHRTKHQLLQHLRLALPDHPGSRESPIDQEIVDATGDLLEGAAKVRDVWTGYEMIIEAVDEEVRGRGSKGESGTEGTMEVDVQVHPVQNEKECHCLGHLMGGVDSILVFLTPAAQPPIGIGIVDSPPSSDSSSSSTSPTSSSLSTEPSSTTSPTFFSKQSPPGSGTDRHIRIDISGMSGLIKGLSQFLYLPNSEELWTLDPTLERGRKSRREGDSEWGAATSTSTWAKKMSWMTNGGQKRKGGGKRTSTSPSSRVRQRWHPKYELCEACDGFMKERPRPGTSFTEATSLITKVPEETTTTVETKKVRGSLVSRMSDFAIRRRKTIEEPKLTYPSAEDLWLGGADLTESPPDSDVRDGSDDTTEALDPSTANTTLPSASPSKRVTPDLSRVVSQNGSTTNGGGGGKTTSILASICRTKSDPSDRTSSIVDSAAADERGNGLRIAPTTSLPSMSGFLPRPASLLKRAGNITASVRNIPIPTPRSAGRRCSSYGFSRDVTREVGGEESNIPDASASASEGSFMSSNQPTRRPYPYHRIVIVADHLLLGSANYYGLRHSLEVHSDYTNGRLQDIFNDFWNAMEVRMRPKNHPPPDSDQVAVERERRAREDLLEERARREGKVFIRKPSPIPEHYLKYNPDDLPEIRHEAWEKYNRIEAKLHRLKHFIIHPELADEFVFHFLDGKVDEDKRIDRVKDESRWEFTRGAAPKLRQIINAR